MVLLQNKLNLRVSQKQILTPGLVQMVSVLALNKLELKEMINTEMVENPVLEELDSSVPLLDEVAGREEAHERQDAKDIKEKDETGPEAEKKDPFDEIDFGSFFRDYLDPGYRNSADLEEIDRPSFENFLSKPGTLSDHLIWQLGSVTVRHAVYAAAELVIGNLNEEGYLTASDDELMGVAETLESEEPAPEVAPTDGALVDSPTEPSHIELIVSHEPTPEAVAAEKNTGLTPVLQFTRDDLREAIALIQHFDPVGVAARDLRECLMAQLEHLIKTRDMEGSDDPENDQVVEDALKMVDKQLHFLQNKQYKEIAKAITRPIDAVIQAHEFIRTLDPKPGLRYNKVEPKLIEPDVAFVKHGDEYLVLMNDEDLPQLRVSPTYRKMLNNQNGGVEKDVKSYVKERYKSAVQLIKNIEQRRQTILKVCYAIIGRQRDFLDQGIDQLKPMMIKEVAEEIGVHPSTVSRAVASKYVHTSQGVFELRYFFSESVQGPEGAGTSLLILKRRVKKLIEEEDPAHPLTDDQITRVLQSQGIQVTRRTVAKYREDMKIPSTHQRRTKS
ncbi:MAG: polymerase, sigma 54 subunit, RpoN/SigL [Candidatus Angelobacter sp.]|jgi:RNA polymerase sigma-54 factor|nr:polymerase, sigma 54 subunit, RpoN/SigL [Candidatus Angelobacter sp.]HEV7675214.1 RNA polymerase factor sigma-54 [Candidatus Angelobacter sp.]